MRILNMLTAELSSINDNVSNQEKVVSKQQELVGKERRLEDVLGKVRKAKYRGKGSS